MRKIFLFFIFLSTVFCQENVDVLYNAAVEKYIKNDYDKAIEYIEKVYSLSPQQKYKNFIIKILYEAANTEYMKHNYKKAYGYTEKALKYTQDDLKINELHKILADILNKQQKITSVEQKPVEVQQRTFVQKQETSQKVYPTSQKKIETKPEQVQVVYYEDKKYKVLTYVLSSLFFLTVISWIITQIKFYKKIKEEQQKQILELQQENSKLKLTLFETKTELEKTKEREQMYKKYLDDYKKEIEEKNKIISQLQNQISIREKISVVPQQTPKMAFLPYDVVVNKQQDEILSFATTVPSKIMKSEYDMELYREKIADMIKTLYEVNPQRTLNTIEQMVNNQNPFVRMNVVNALSELATEETINYLIKLYNDNDLMVKREALRQLIKLQQKIKTKEITLPQQLEQEVLQIVKEEKQKGEWLF